MAGIFERGWEWIEGHPWWTAGGIAGVGILFLLWRSSSAGSTSGPPLTAAQSLQLARLQGQQQVAAIKASQLGSVTASRAGEAAAAVTARGQTQAADEATNGQTEQARIAAQVADLQTTTGLTAEEKQIAGELAYQSQGGQIAIGEGSQQGQIQIGLANLWAAMIAKLLPVFEAQQSTAQANYGNYLSLFGPNAQGVTPGEFGVESGIPSEFFPPSYASSAPGF